MTVSLDLTIHEIGLSLHLFSHSLVSSEFCNFLHVDIVHILLDLYLIISFLYANGNINVFWFQIPFIHSWYIRKWLTFLISCNLAVIAYYFQEFFWPFFWIFYIGSHGMCKQKQFLFLLFQSVTLSKPWFPNLSAADIVGLVIFVLGAFPVQCKISSILGLCPVDVSSIPSQLWWPKMSLDVAKHSSGPKSTPTENF